MTIPGRGGGGSKDRQDTVDFSTPFDFFRFSFYCMIFIYGTCRFYPVLAEVVCDRQERRQGSSRMLGGWVDARLENRPGSDRADWTNASFIHTSLILHSCDPGVTRYRVG